MNWRYARHGRLVVSNCDLTALNLSSLRKMIKIGLIPDEPAEIILETPLTVCFIRGRYLRGWLDGHLED